MEGVEEGWILPQIPSAVDAHEPPRVQRLTRLLEETGRVQLTMGVSALEFESTLPLADADRVVAIQFRDIRRDGKRQSAGDFMALVLRSRNGSRTETGDAPALQGATTAHTGSM